MSNGWTARLLLVLVLLATAGLLVCAFWLLWPYDVLRPETEVMPLLYNELKPGDPIIYHARYTKLMDVTGIAAVGLVNDIVVVYPPVVFAGAPGVYDMWGRGFSVPLNAPPGEFHLEFSVEYRVNPIRTVIERYRTETFEVTK